MSKINPIGKVVGHYRTLPNERLAILIYWIDTKLNELAKKHISDDKDIIEIRNLFSQLIKAIVEKQKITITKEMVNEK